MKKSVKGKGNNSTSEKHTKSQTDSSKHLHNGSNQKHLKYQSDNNENTEQHKKRKKKNNHKVLKGILISIVILLVVAVAAYCVFGLIVYNNKFLPKTTVEGISCEGMDSATYISELSSKVDEYSLDIKKAGQIVDSIKSEDVNINLTDDINDRIDLVINGQNRLLWGLGYIKEPEEIKLESYVTVDDETYETFIVESEGYNLPTTVENKNQSVEFVDGKFKVGDPIYGDEIDKDAYKAAVKENLLALNKEMELNDSYCYTKPTEMENVEKFEEACEKTNSMLNYGGFSIKCDGIDSDLAKEIAEASVVIDDNFNVTFNQETINNAVSKVAAKYNTIGITRKFKTSHGTIVDVEGGDYGCKFSTKNLAVNAGKALLNGEKVDLTLDYTQNVLDPNVEGIGNTYVEVDLTNQYAFVYIDGKLVVETAVVTGLAGTSRATPQGTYMLKNKMKNVTLVGDNYRTPVSYWMPFNGGIGLHDATWQPRFGGELYRTRGSHGCVNLPLKKAGDIYDAVIVKMPVVCYYHERLSNFQPTGSSGMPAGVTTMAVSGSTGDSNGTASEVVAEAIKKNNTANNSSSNTSVGNKNNIKKQTNSNSNKTPAVNDNTNDNENNTIIDENGNVISENVIHEQVITPSAID